MRLKGTVCNVVAFGAFIDIGVKQDGLVHISEMADRYIRDPHEVVGDVVDVRVVSIDKARGRIALSMKSMSTDWAIKDSFMSYAVSLVGLHNSVDLKKARVL